MIQNNFLRKILKFLSWIVGALSAVYLLVLAFVIPYYVNLLESYKPVGVEEIKSHYQLRGQNPRDYGFDFEELSFQTNDNITLSGWYIKSKNPSDTCILMVHGWKSFNASCLPYLEIVKEYGIDNNHNIFMLNLRNSGNSSKTPTDLGYKTARDVVSGIRFLSSLGMREIKCFSISMGALATVRALSSHAEEIEATGVKITKVLLDSPLANAKHAIKSEDSVLAQLLNNLIYIPFFMVINRRWDNTLEELRISRAIDKLDLSSLLILQGEKDRLTKLQALRDELRGFPVELKVFEQGSHARLYKNNKREYAQIFKTFFLSSEG